MIPATQMRKGMTIRHENELYVVVDKEHVAPGNWRAMVQAKLKSLARGTIIQYRFRSTDKVDEVYLDGKEMEYLYPEGDRFCFMDTATYEQYMLPKEVVADASSYLTLNLNVKVTFHEGNPLSIELPTSVVLKVIETEPGFRGNTATNVQKPAKTETGLTVHVPPFVEIGQKIKVDTRTGEFLEKAD